MKKKSVLRRQYAFCLYEYCINIPYENKGKKNLKRNEDYAVDDDILFCHNGSYCFIGAAFY